MCKLCAIWDEGLQWAVKQLCLDLQQNGASSRILPVHARCSEFPLLTSAAESHRFLALMGCVVPRRLLCSTKTKDIALRPPPLGFACRRGERPFGPSRIRPCGLTAASHPASRFARLASTSLPGRSAGLRSGLFCGAKRSRRCIRLPRPVGPFACSGRANLPSKHTHECGSISSGWPPNQPASRIAKLFGEGGARGAGRPRA